MGSNHRPRLYKSRALPLSYAPTQEIKDESAASYKSGALLHPATLKKPTVRIELTTYSLPWDCSTS